MGYTTLGICKCELIYERNEFDYIAVGINYCDKHETNFALVEKLEKERNDWQEKYTDLSYEFYGMERT